MTTAHDPDRETKADEPLPPMTVDEWWLVRAVVRRHATAAYDKAANVPSAALRKEWEKEAQRLDVIALKLNALMEQV